MASPLRHPTDRVVSTADEAALSRLQDTAALWRALEEAPYAFDLFFSLRWIDARYPNRPRLGRSERPTDDPVRVGQHVSLTFAPATIHKAGIRDDGMPVLHQAAFGLFGPNGPLPTHITELVHERIVTANDLTLASFADIFHHRAATLFYRGWADAQSTVSLDRQDDDHFSRYVSSLIGYGMPPLCHRDEAPDHAKRFAAGHLVRQSRNPEGLKHCIEHYYQLPCRLDELQLNWLVIEPGQQTQLGAPDARARLGHGAFIGGRVPDRQYAFSLRLGPMPLSEYEHFLPTGKHFVSLIDWVRNYVGYEYLWSLRLVLRRDEVPRLQLGEHSRLGWTTWMKAADENRDRDDLRLFPEHVVRGPGTVQA